MDLVQFPKLIAPQSNRRPALSDRIFIFYRYLKQKEKKTWHPSENKTFPKHSFVFLIFVASIYGIVLEIVHHHITVINEEKEELYWKFHSPKPTIELCVGQLLWGYLK